MSLSRLSSSSPFCVPGYHGLTPQLPGPAQFAVWVVGVEWCFHATVAAAEELAVFVVVEDFDQLGLDGVHEAVVVQAADVDEDGWQAGDDGDVVVGWVVGVLGFNVQVDDDAGRAAERG